MPRNVRNFWLELSIDGSATRVETGPKAKDGGFKLVILQRDKGGIVRAMEIDGWARDNGELRLTATVRHGTIDRAEPGNTITVRTER